MVFNDIHKKILDAYLDPFLYANFFNAKDVSRLYPPCLYPPCLYPTCLYPPCLYPPCLYPPCLYPPCLYPPCLYPPCLYPTCLYPPCLEHFKIEIFFYVLHNSIGFNKKSDLSIPNKLSYGY